MMDLPALPDGKGDSGGRKWKGKIKHQVKTLTPDDIVQGRTFKASLWDIKSTASVKN